MRYPCLTSYSSNSYSPNASVSSSKSLKSSANRFHAGVASYSIESPDRSSSASLDSKSSSSKASKKWLRSKRLLSILMTVLLVALVLLISYTLIFVLPGSSVTSSMRSQGNHKVKDNIKVKDRQYRVQGHMTSETAHIASKAVAPPIKSPPPAAAAPAAAASANSTAEQEDDSIDTVESGPSTESLDPVIESKSGLIIGTSTRVLDKIINSFLGIPYALPPVGDHRFRRPEPIPSWGKDALEAKNFSDPCIQFSPSHAILTPWMSDVNLNGSEDCLYLNIWSPEDPKKPEAEVKTILVWLHGGAFFSGSADLDLYNGQIMSAMGDVVVVSVNYRLGALGFLTTNSDEISGNMGMFDQVMALKWIKENAESFGGDGDNIVLFGQSAGATSAGLHLFSPLTRDIPSRVILQSGGPLFPKIYFENQLEKSNLFSHHVGCGNKTDDLLTNSSSTLDCLMNLSIEEIVDGHKPMFELYKIPFFPHPGDEFLPDLPHDLVHDPSNLGPQTEILMGNMEDEGALFLHLFFPDIFANSESSKSIANFTIDDARHYIAKAYSFIPENQAQVMSQFFLSSLGGVMNNNSRESVLKATHDIIGDSGFVCPAVLLSEIMSEYNISVYHYLMNGRPSTSEWSKWMGSTHMDDVEFVFGLPIRYPSRYTDAEIGFSKQLIHTWTTFAKTGSVPDINNVTWPVYSKEEPYYLELNATSTRIKASPHKSSCNLWKIIYDSFL